MLCWLILCAYIFSLLLNDIFALTSTVWVIVMCVLLACMHIRVCKFYGFVEWQCLFFLLQPCFGDFVKVSCFSVFKAGSAWDYSTVVNFSKNGLAWRPYSSVTNLSGILNALLSLISQLAFPNGHICLCPTKYSHSHFNAQNLLLILFISWCAGVLHQNTIIQQTSPADVWRGGIVISQWTSEKTRLCRC